MMFAVGFFHELAHGANRGPSLREAMVNPLSAMEREAIGRYLRGCPVVIATSQRAPDILDPQSPEKVALNIHCDGKFVWSDECVYYVETYGARLPQAFLDHVRLQDGPPRREELPEDLTDDVLAAMQAEE